MSRFFKGFVYLAGGLGLCRFGAEFGYALYLNYHHSMDRRTLRNYFQQYGSKPCAVITGATDGIGLDYSRELADLDVNLILVSRSDEKLQKVKTELQTQHPNLSIDVIPFDFTNVLCNFPDLQTRLNEAAQGKEVTILISNVGVASKAQYFHNHPLSAVQQLITVNVGAPVFMTRWLLDKQRNKSQNTEQNRKLLVNIGSVAGEVPSPFLADYGGSKGFGNQLYRALSYEYMNDPKLSLVLVPYGPVRTPMLAKTLGQAGIIGKVQEESREIVHNTLCEIAANPFKSGTIQGSFKHFIYRYLLSFNPFIGGTVRARMLKANVKED